jgi:hypothetical protein
MSLSHVYERFDNSNDLNSIMRKSMNEASQHSTPPTIQSQHSIINKQTGNSTML